MRDVQTKQEPAYENIAATNCKKNTTGCANRTTGSVYRTKKRAAGAGTCLNKHHYRKAIQQDMQEEDM